MVGVEGRPAPLGGGDARDSDWWSSLLNYVVSVFFMLSALTAVTLTTTGEMVNIAVVNSGTFVGALCFLIGSYVLLPPSSTTASSAIGA